MPAMRIATGHEVTEAIKHCGNSADLVDYCKKRLERQFVKAKLTKEPAIQQLLQQLGELEIQLSEAEAIREKNIWFGVEPQSNDAIQTQIKQENTLRTLSKEGVERLKFRYALAEDGRFIRAFGIDGKAVKDAALIQRLDDIVHQAFAEQHLSLASDGRLRSHADGKARPVTENELNAVFKGLEKTCKHHHIEFVVQPEPYPSSAQSLPKATAPTIVQPSAGQDVAPIDTPSTGPGAQS